MILSSLELKEVVYGLINRYPYNINILSIENKKAYMREEIEGFSSKLDIVGYVVGVKDKGLLMVEVLRYI